MICIEVKSIISAEGASYGHEQQADRPAVIVSNERTMKTVEWSRWYI